MVRFSHHSAQVSHERLPSGASLVAFYGMLTKKGFDSLRKQAREHASSAPAVVVRMDTALLAEGEDFMRPEMEACPHEAVAFVVPPDRYEQAMTLARRMATMFGVRRLVFLPEQAALAYQWAAHVAQSQSSTLPR